MEWVETTGRTVAEALEAALDELGVDEQDAEVVVVAEPRAGILGIGRSAARVRARVRPTAPRPKRPQRSRHRDQRRSSRGQDGAADSVTEESRGATGRRATEASDTATPSRGAATRGSRPPGMPRRRRSGGGKVAKAPAENGGIEGGAPMSVEQQAEAVESFVRGVVERFGYDEATTTVRIEEEQIVVEVAGDGLGLLIGQRGRTLDALQELARTVVQRRGDEPPARVVVDVAGFRAKRVAALQAFVRRLAEQALASGEAQELEPMSAADRKVVHDTVAAIDGVESTSEGTEPDRYVVLRPTDQRRSAEEELA